MWIWRFSNKKYINSIFLQSNSFSENETKTDSIIVFLSYKVNINSDLCIFASAHAIPNICFWKYSFFFLWLSTFTDTFLWYWIFFAVPAYVKSTHLIGHQDSLSSPSPINTAELQYRALDEKFRPPTADPYHYLLILDSQISNHPRQDVRYIILRVNRINKSLQNFTITRYRKQNRLTLTTIEFKFEVTVEFIECSSTSNFNSNQTTNSS